MTKKEKIELLEKELSISKSHYRDLQILCLDNLGWLEKELKGIKKVLSKEARTHHFCPYCGTKIKRRGRKNDVKNVQ